MKTAPPQMIEEGPIAAETEGPPLAPDPVSMSAGTAAISGALAGAAGGPICVVIGAAVGAIAGGVSALEPRAAIPDDPDGQRQD